MINDEMVEEPTDDIVEILESLSTSYAVEDYIKKSCKRDEKYYFYQYLDEVMKEKGLALANVARKSGINRNYVYNITNGNKLNPSRDKVIALCLASEMTIIEACQGLEIAGFSRLRSKSERDVRIAVAIRDKIFDAFEVNKTLEKHRLPLLKI